MSRNFDGEILFCEVRSPNNLIKKELSRLEIDYPPLSADISFSGQFVGDQIGSTCTANGRPAPAISYILANQSAEFEIDEKYILTKSDQNKYLKCRAKNKYGAKNSTQIRLIIQIPTPTPTQKIQFTTQTTNLVTSTQTR